MSVRPVHEPQCHDAGAEDPIETVIEARNRDVDGLPVRRVLPSIRRRAVGPYVFFDHMGPADLSGTEGIQVRPHPHINLATVTYLFEGEIVHRDSVGSHQSIRPGALNWMTAGRGIVHSERSPADPAGLHGIQLWIALPPEFEELEPAFHHHPEDTLPRVARPGADLRVLIGNAYGAASPVRTYSEMFYVEARLGAGAQLELPGEHHDRAAYLVDGAISAGDLRVSQPRMIVFEPGQRAVVRAEADSRIMLLGGAPLEGPRHMWWNFVSSRKDRIETAKADWKARRFAAVPGDDVEFIPLPER